MKKFFKEFKAFISRGNVFDMAIGLIIATAFNKIVSSLVNDIIMPLITWATGAASLKDLSVPLKTAVDAVTGETVVTLSWAYGSFIQYIIDFLIIALSVFLMVKLMNGYRNRMKELSSFIGKQSKKEYRQERKAVKLKAKAENRPFKEVWAEHLAAKQKEAEEKVKLEEEEKKKQAELDRLNNPTQEDLLKEIRDLLKEKNDKK